MRLRDRLAERARLLRSDTLALYLVARHPETPLGAKVLAGAVAAYALSPIDLIPDFVPVLGYLDDLLLVPLGITLAIRMVPEAVLTECRQQAEATFAEGTPVSRFAAYVVAATWLLGTMLLALWVLRILE